MYHIRINTPNLHMRYKSVLATRKCFIVWELFKQTFRLIPIETFRRYAGYTLPNGKGTKGQEIILSRKFSKFRARRSPAA